MPTKKSTVVKKETAKVKPVKAVKAKDQSDTHATMVDNGAEDIKIRKDLVPLYQELVRQRERIARDMHTEYEEIEASELSDWVDLASASHERELSIILNGNKDEVLLRIDQALEMIKSGTYGICANCKQPIAKERLKAIPFTRLCIHCQDKLERYARG